MITEVGDIESLPFIEAIRQFKKEVGRNDAAAFEKLVAIAKENI